MPIFALKQFIDWFVHKRYQITLVDLIYSKLYSISWILGNDYPVSTRSNHVIKDSIYYSGLDSKVWRNHLSLFRSCEYDLFEKKHKVKPLTNYDMNFTSIDHQEFFTCYNDYCYPEFELMAKVWRLKDRKLRILCSYKALELNQNCSTALILLAEERATNFQMVERILKLALKAAQNNFCKSRILIDTFDLKDDVSVNTTNENSCSSLDQLDKLAYSKKANGGKAKLPPTNSGRRSTSSNAFKNSGDFTNLNNLMGKFKFHSIEKEVKELLKELAKEDGDKYDSVMKALNLKLNFDSPSSANAELDKECYNLNELILNEIDSALGNLTPENLPYKSALFTDELIRDYKVILYTKRRLGMCLRRLGKLNEALKLFKELNKELPTVNAFSCLENLMEIYLTLGAYSDLQALLAKYDGKNFASFRLFSYFLMCTASSSQIDIKMPKSAAICYTTALMKIRNCAERYQNMKEEPLSASFLSYNYFNEVNYFQIPDVHVVNTVSKMMNATTSPVNDSSNSSTSILASQNGGPNHFNSTSLKNGHSGNLNGYSNGSINGHANSVLGNNLTNGNCGSSPIGGSPFALQIRAECVALEQVYRACEFNPFVPIYLLQLKSITIPTEHVIRRGDSEAIAYAFFFLKHWKSVPGALTMLEKCWKNGNFDQFV